MAVPEITALLRAWSAGDLAARDRLVPLAYAELRRRAVTSLRRERRHHTLQPTALAWPVDRNRRTALAARSGLAVFRHPREASP